MPSQINTMTGTRPIQEQDRKLLTHLFDKDFEEEEAAQFLQTSYLELSCDDVEPVSGKPAKTTETSCQPRDLTEARYKTWNKIKLQLATTDEVTTVLCDGIELALADDVKGQLNREPKNIIDEVGRCVTLEEAKRVQLVESPKTNVPAYRKAIENLFKRGVTR